MKRRILYIQYTNPAGYPPLQHSSRMLADRGWRVLFLGTGALGAGELRFPPHGNIAEKRIPFERPGWKQKVQFGYYALWVLAHVVWWRPDWVYASDWLATPAGLLASAVPGVKLAYHEHDSPGAATNAFARLCWWARRAVAQRAAICVLPSADRAAVFAEQTGAAARVVWNCPSQTEVGTGKSAGEASRLTILYQGSIVRERLPLEVVDALAQAPAGVCLRIFGYEPNPDDPHVPKMLERARALGIAERIDYRGAFSRSDLLPKTAEGDIGLSLMPMTSNDVNMRHMAGASNKPFEYLSQGLPLIVPDLKEWRETFVDRGLAVACDPRDAGSIAAAIRWYWEHRAEMVEMGERGRRQVAQAWNYESQFAPVVEELEKGLEGAGAPAGRAAVDRHA